MSRVGSRAFSTTARYTLKRKGATDADIIAQNPGKDVSLVIAAIKRVEGEAEDKVRLAASHRDDGLLTM